MDGTDVWQLVTQLLRDHWPEATFSIVCLAFGAWWGRRRAQRQWLKKEFLHRINVSLNTFHEGRLLIRTLLESDLDAIFLNSIAVEKILKAIPKTTEQDPLLPVDSADAWFLLNAVLNEISEQFALGNIKRDLGVETKTARYLICLTFEVSGEVRTRKVRAMVIQKDRLLNLPGEMPILESPLHSTRVETLRKLAKSFETKPEHFLEIEISV